MKPNDLSADQKTIDSTMRIRARNHILIFSVIFLISLILSGLAKNHEEGRRQLEIQHHPGTRKEKQESHNAIPDVSKTFVINAKYRIDRMEEIKEKLQDLKIPYERFEAVDFKNDLLNPEFLHDIPRLHNQTRIDISLVQVSLKKRKEITWETVGRWQSHVQIYLDIAYGDSLDYPGPFLVLEDNAYLTEKTLQYLRKDFLKTLPKHWDLLIIDTLFHNCAETRESKDTAASQSQKFCKVKSAFGIHGYLIKNTEVAVRLCSAFNTPFPRISDFFMSRLFENGKLIAYVPITKEQGSSPPKAGVK